MEKEKDMKNVLRDIARIRQILAEPLEKGYDPKEVAKELARLKVQSHNRRFGKDETTGCAACNYRGNYAELREDGTDVAFVMCDCRQRYAVDQLIRSSGMEGFVREKSLASFGTEEPWQKAMLEAARAYLEDPKGWFMVCGQPGSGKSHLCAGICLELLNQNKQVLYWPWEEYKALILNGGKETEDRITILKEVPYLYIDDLFKTVRGTPVHPWEVRCIWRVLDARYRNNLPTIFSTEHTPEQLITLDEAIGSRILERCGENALVVCRKAGRNQRLSKRK